MILYLIIAPTLPKPEVWHELIRVVKIKRFMSLKKYKDVDIEAVACVHNLQYSSVQLNAVSRYVMLCVRAIIGFMDNNNNNHNNKQTTTGFVVCVRSNI